MPNINLIVSIKSPTHNFQEIVEVDAYGVRSILDGIGAFKASCEVLDKIIAVQEIPYDGGN